MIGFYLVYRLRMARGYMCFQGQLVQKRITADFAHMRAVAFMLSLQVIVQCRRIAIRMGRSRLWLEVTKVTHQMTAIITLVTYNLLLLVVRDFNHCVCASY
jgi:hypothetical protein